MLQLVSSSSLQTSPSSESHYSTCTHYSPRNDDSSYRAQKKWTEPRRMRLRKLPPSPVRAWPGARGTDYCRQLEFCCSSFFLSVISPTWTSSQTAFCLKSLRSKYSVTCDYSQSARALQIRSRYVNSRNLPYSRHGTCCKRHDSWLADTSGLFCWIKRGFLHLV